MPKVAIANKPKVVVGSGVPTILNLLIAIALAGTELLKTMREMLAVSLRRPIKIAELSSAREEVPGMVKVSSNRSFWSKAEIMASNCGVSSTAI